MIKQYIFTMVFVLLLINTSAKPPKTSYFIGVWDGKPIQINNPQEIGKNKFCVQNIFINGKKIKTSLAVGGIEFDPNAFGFIAGDEFLITIWHKKDCEPNFHSKGFRVQKD